MRGKSGILNLLYLKARREYCVPMRHVISLSTIPPRFADVGATLQSLVRQKSRPEAVELYIPRSYRRFPEWGGALPEVPEGVTIVRVEDDLGPATKILPAVRAYQGQDIDLLYVDDDNHYAPDWAARFLKVRRQRPNAVLCAVGLPIEKVGRPWRATAPLPRAVHAPGAVHQFGFHVRRLVAVLAPKPDQSAPKLRQWYRKIDRSGYVDIAEGFSGVALRPEFLDDAVYKIPPVLWAVDDIWISGHLARRGVPIWADKSLNRAREFADVYHSNALYKAVIDGADRAQANLACVDYMRATYGIWGGEATQSV